MSACSRCRSIYPNAGCSVCKEEDEEAREEHEQEQADAARKEESLSTP